MFLYYKKAKPASPAPEKLLELGSYCTDFEDNFSNLCGVFGSKMEGLVGNLASRISKSNFRNAVESDITNRMLATVFEIDRNKYDKLRAKAIVKRTNGSIDILEAINESEDDI